MKLGIIRLYSGESGKVGYYNIQEIGLAKALAKKGIKTDIFFLIDKNKNKKVIINEINKDIRIIYIPALKIANHGIVSPRFILDYNLDIIHLLSDNQIMVPSFIRFCKMNNIPMYNYVGTIDSDTNNKLKKIVMSFISRRNVQCYKNSLTVTKTLEVKEKLEAKGVNDIRLIPVGLDLDIIPNISKEKNNLRIELGLPIKKKILMFVGRLEEYKKPDKSIEVLNELLKVNKNYLLVIIGHGSLKSVLLEKINKYNLQDNIIIIEKIQNSKIHEYYKASDIFLNFNNKEIFGMSILEAMYQGCKVLAVNAPGPNFIIENNVDGILIKDFNYWHWVDKIEYAFKRDELGVYSKQKIENKFNWNSISQKYVDLFKEILGEQNEKV